MTITERITKRLSGWHRELNRRKNAMSELEEGNDEWWMQKVQTEILEMCIAELSRDLASYRHR